MRLGLLSVTIACGGCDRPDPTAASDDPRFRQLIVAAEAASSQNGFSGVVGIALKGTIVFLRSHGLADRSGSIENTPSTKFVVASVTQTFTAVAVFQLVQRGQVGLETSVSSVLPELANTNTGRATVGELLDHTAGIGRVVTTGAFRRAPVNFRTLGDYLKLVTAEPMTGKPGSEFRYTDGDSVLLGAMIERKTGQGYYEYVAENVFQPAKMTDTGFDLQPRPRNLAVGYTTRGADGSASQENAEPHENSAMLPARASPGAGAYSTAEDLLLFGGALLHGDLLLPEKAVELFEGHVLTGEDGPRAHYGFGFFDGNSQNIRIVNHGGTGPGIDVGFDLYPESGFVVVVLSNQDPPSAQRVRDQLRSKISEVTHASN
jgi:CubicO group peptidase (beta-lactamase class C family)